MSSKTKQHLRMKDKREYYSSGAPWEQVVGYSRAVKVGNTIHIAGTTAMDSSGNLVGAGDAYAQAIQILRNIEQALAHFGATMPSNHEEFSNIEHIGVVSRGRASSGEYEACDASIKSD